MLIDFDVDKPHPQITSISFNSIIFGPRSFGRSSIPSGNKVSKSFCDTRWQVNDGDVRSILAAMESGKIDLRFGFWLDNVELIVSDGGLSGRDAVAQLRQCMSDHTISIDGEE